MNNKIEILSVGIPVMTRCEVMREIEAALCEKRGMKIFTPNPEMLLGARKDPALSAILNSADLLLPDGIGIKIASHIMERPIPERISGIDTALDILRLAEARGLSVFLLGGKEGTADKAAKNLKSLLPRLNICGTHHGYFEKSGEKNTAVIEKIRSASPDILFVCFGFPLQEDWICKNSSALPSVRVSMGLGGSLDVWSGEKKRAPKFIQRVGFEWLWRSVLEPKRLKIFLEIPEFLYFALKER